MNKVLSGLQSECQLLHIETNKILEAIPNDDPNILLYQLNAAIDINMLLREGIQDLVN